MFREPAWWSLCYCVSVEKGENGGLKTVIPVSTRDEGLSKIQHWKRGCFRFWRCLGTRF